MKKFDFKVGEYYLTDIPEAKAVEVVFRDGPSAIMQLITTDGVVWIISVDENGEFNTPFEGKYITSKCDEYGTPIMTLPSEYTLTIDDSCAIKGPFGEAKDQYLEDIKKTWFSNDQLSDMWNKYED